MEILSLIPRLHNWLKLRRKANNDKKSGESIIANHLKVDGFKMEKVKSQKRLSIFLFNSRRSHAPTRIYWP